MDEERRYSDREVEALLARAVELSRPKAAEPRPRGMSLAEIEKAAEEAGLDPGLLARAAAELEADRAGGGLLGELKGSERALLGRQPEEGELQRLLQDLPDMAGFAGSGVMSGNSLVWRSDGSVDANTGRKIRLEVRRVPEGRAAVELRWDARGAAGGVYGGIVGGVGLGAGLGIGLGVGIGSLHAPLFALLFILGSIGLSFGGARLLLGAFASDARRRAKRLVEEIRARLQNP